MTSLALAVGLFMSVIGIMGMVAPASFHAIARYAATPLGLWAAAAVRVVIGMVLVRAAPISRFPKVLRLIGFTALVLGLFTPLIGVHRAQTVSNWSAAHLGVIRSWSVVAVVFGVFVLYAVSRKRHAV